MEIQIDGKIDRQVDGEAGSCRTGVADSDKYLGG